MQTPELSIIVVYFNEKDLILPAVGSMHASAGSVAHEILVVENGAPEPVPEEVRRVGDWLRVLRVETNHGYAAGCNRGWEAASGRYLLFINPDTEVRGDAIPRLVDFLRGNPRVGAVSCRIVDGEGRFVPHLFEFPSPWWSLVYAVTAVPARWGWLRRRLGNRLVRYHDPFRSCPVDWMVGCAVMVRREAFEQIGGWEESYFIYAEEIDLYFRLAEAGWTAHYVADGEIVHYGGQSDKPGSERRFLQGYRSRYKFIERHMGPTRAWAFRLITAAKQVGGVLVDGVLWLLGLADRGRRLRTLRARWKLVLISLKILE
jgi:GT2 family glycosyltransferase